MIHIDLSNELNSKGLTKIKDHFLGDLTPLGTSIPNFINDSIIKSHNSNMSYIINDSVFDNIECNGQELLTKKSEYINTIGFIGVSVYGNHDDIVLLEDDIGNQLSKPISFSAFHCQEPYYSDNYSIYEFREYLHSPIKGKERIEGTGGNLWEFTLSFKERIRLKKITLPDNPCIHIFSITVE
ncbi:hypothetical protein ABID30_000747 [Enterococcus rotai]|uniref:Uncharacterized protein n=1 Tax=Enterococcus rotai TaxID=118060 RepID=A0A0U2LU13_9ENTE|nr:hypothetical protein [Enterococcus rotai]ALS36069.1 hypothetical protein ATZ35_02500 [Enterococcus rotai]